MSIHHADGAVKRPRTLLQSTSALCITRFGERWYLAPDTLHLDKPRFAGKEVQPGNIFRSTRSYDGRRYDADCLNINAQILGLIEEHGLHRVQVVISYKKHGTTYDTTTATFREHGEYQPYSGGQIALQRCYWSIDGHPPIGPLLIVPAAEQPSLFDLAATGRTGAY